MPQVNQVQNLLLAQAPPNVRAQAQAGEEAVQRAAAPSAPYSSRTAGLLRALEGGLGGMMEGSAMKQAAEGQRAALAQGYGLLNSLQPGGGAAGAPAASGSVGAAPSGGGAGSAGHGPGDYLGRLGQIESGNRDGISNKASGATGRYQFIASTWDRLSKQYPELGLTPDGRTDPAQQQRAIRAFTNDNISALGRSGFQATPGNLYLAHFAGAGGATAALRADPNTPVEQIMGGAAVRANPFLKGKTAGDLVAWANGKMAGVDPSTVSGAPPSPSPATGTAVAGASPAHPTAAPPPGSAPIGDTAALAAQNRLTSGKGTDADRALLATYRQQQNTPQAGRTASADMPAPNAQPVAGSGLPNGVTAADFDKSAPAVPASDGTVRGDLMAAVAQHGGLDPDMPAPGATPTGMAGLPPGVTPAMWAASQNTAADGNALRRGDEVPAGTPPYVPGAGPQGPNLPAGGGTVTASGVPHQLAPGASARADSGVATSVSSGPSDTASGVLQPQPDPEGAGAQDHDPNAEPSLRDTLEAAFKGPDLGKVGAAVTPDPAPLGPGDQVGPGGLVAQPGPLPGQGGTAGAQPNTVAPAPLAPGDVVGADRTVTPASDGSVKGDLLAAAAQHGMNVSGAPVVPPPQGDLTAPVPAPAPDPVAAGQMAGRDVALDPVVPDPQGAAVPPAPSSPNDALQGPQSDAAAGNGGDDLRAMLTAQVMGSGAGTTGPQSDAAMGGGAPVGADGPAAPQAGPQAASPAGLPSTAPLPPPGAQTIQAATDAASAAAPTVDPNAVGLPATEPTLRDHLEAAFNGTPLPGGASAPGPGAAPNRMAGADVGDAGLDGMRAGMVAQQPGSAPAPAGAPAAPANGPAAPSAMGALSAPPPSGMAGQGGQSSSDLSKMAVGPLTPSYMSGLASALSTPAQPAAAPHPMALANALDGSKPAPGATPAGPAPMPPTAAPMPPVPQFGGSGTNAPAGNSPSADPSSPQNFMRSEIARAQGGASQPSGFMGSLQSLFAPGSTAASGSAQAPQQGTPAQARAIAQQTQANPNASPAAQSMAGQVMAATGGQVGDGQTNGAASPGYTSPAMAPAPSGAPAAAPAAVGAGGWTPEQRQSALSLLSSPQAAYLPAELREALTAKLFPTPTKMAAGEGLVGLRADGTYGELYSQPSKDQYVYAPDGVHVLNKGTGQVTTPGASGADGGGGWRAMTPAELQRYGVTDGRPAYIAPNGEPHFGMPGTQGQGETEEAKESGKAAAGRQNDMLMAANAAPEKLARLGLMRTVLHNTATGPLAGEAGTVSSVATRLGIAPDRLASLGLDPNQAVNNAIASKLANEMTMGSIGAKNGGMPASNFSVAERQFIETLYPSIENQAGGNEALLDVLSATEQKKQQWGDAWSDYKDQQRAAGKALSYGDFEDSFRRAHANENIFAPIMAKYQAGGYTPTAPSPGGVPNAASAGGGQGVPATPSRPATPTPQPGGQGTPGGGTPSQGGGQAAQPQAGQGGDPLSQARAAIARGAPRAAVIQRLQGMGVNTAGL